MPNHVKHRVVVTGPEAEVDRFKSECIRPHPEDGERVFDFNALVPMPEVLRDTISGSLVPMGLVALGRTDLADRHTAEFYLNWAHIRDKGIHTAEQFAEYVRREEPDAVAAAEKAIAAHEQCGHIDWYTWSIANWGTKWNSYSFRDLADSPGHYEFTFATAWSPPEPIFEVLAERYPALAFSIACFDEGWGFAGTGTIAGGESDFATCEATRFLYELVYGCEYEEDEDEEDEDEEEDE